MFLLTKVFFIEWDIKGRLEAMEDAYAETCKRVSTLENLNQILQVQPTFLRVIDTLVMQDDYSGLSFFSSILG